MARRTMIAAVLAAGACACSGGDPDPIAETTGPSPELEQPRVQAIPAIRIAKPIGWSEGETPAAPDGFAVNAFARDLDHPRSIEVLDNGDVLVAEASTLPREGGGVRGFFERRIMRRSGAIEDASPDRIVLLRDSDGDGAAEYRAVLAEGLSQPFGMAVLDGFLYVANTNSIVRFPFEPGQTELSDPPETVAALPYNPGRNGHWTRDLIVSQGGARLFVSVGSVSNAGDAGMAVEENRAAILSFAPDGSDMRVYASGLRNPVGMDFEPGSGALWTVVNERDMLGDDLPPDYMTEVVEGAFYGWPWSYFGDNADPRFDESEIPADKVAQARVPDYALGAHTASLGLEFYDASALPARWRGGAFIGQHGSWNRSEFAGYKVVFVPFEAGAPAGAAEDFATGFLTEDGKARGRPVDVAVASDGALLVADDVGDVIWRVAAQP